MSGKFVSLILAASIAVTGLTAAPAQAGERDVARVLAALAGIAVIGVVLHEAQKNRRYAAPQHPRPIYGNGRSFRKTKGHKRQHTVADNAHRHADRRRAGRALEHPQDRYSARPRLNGY